MRKKRHKKKEQTHKTQWRINYHGPPLAILLNIVPLSSPTTCRREDKRQPHKLRAKQDQRTENTEWSAPEKKTSIMSPPPLPISHSLSLVQTLSVSLDWSLSEPAQKYNKALEQLWRPNNNVHHKGQTPQHPRQRPTNSNRDAKRIRRVSESTEC